MSDQSPQEGERILCRTANDSVRVEVLYESETFWLDQQRIAGLFGVEIPASSYHPNEIYESGELDREATVRRIQRLKSDVSVAKNYLIAREIKELQRIVSMYVDYAETQAARQIPMKMADWVAKLDAFLQSNESEVLANAGKVSAEASKRPAEAQYDKFPVRQDREFERDFEAELKRIASKRPRKRNEEP